MNDGASIATLTNASFDNIREREGSTLRNQVSVVPLFFFKKPEVGWTVVPTRRIASIVCTRTLTATRKVLLIILGCFTKYHRSFFGSTQDFIRVPVGLTFPMGHFACLPCGRGVLGDNVTVDSR